MSRLVSTLTERVTFQNPVLSDDGYGGKAVQWTDFAHLFASVQPVYANWREQEMAGKPNARSGYRIIIRSRTDIEATMRILWKTHTLSIHSLHETMQDTLSILTFEENL